MPSEMITDEEYEELRETALGLITDEEIDSLPDDEDRRQIRELIKELRIC